MSIRVEPLKISDQVVVRDGYLLKRPLDVVLALVGLIVSVPLAVLLALVIKILDGGPVLYTQERWGRNGQPFRILKFRTMKIVADERTGGLRPIEEQVTPLGHVLRSVGLDEIPQFINVLCGHMSIAGPRPVAIADVVYIGGEQHTYDKIPGFAERMAVRPGIASPSMLLGDEETDPLLRLDNDVRYVVQQSLWLDLRVIFAALWVAARGRCESGKGPATLVDRDSVSTSEQWALGPRAITRQVTRPEEPIVESRWT